MSMLHLSTISINRTQGKKFEQLKFLIKARKSWFHSFARGSLSSSSGFAKLCNRILFRWSTSWHLVTFSQTEWMVSMIWQHSSSSSWYDFHSIIFTDQQLKKVRRFFEKSALIRPFSTYSSLSEASGDLRERRPKLGCARSSTYRR